MYNPIPPGRYRVSGYVFSNTELYKWGRRINNQSPEEPATEDIFDDALFAVQDLAGEQGVRLGYKGAWGKSEFFPFTCSLMPFPGYYESGRPSNLSYQMDSSQRPGITSTERGSKAG
jgi:hypothetical protein